LKILKEQEAGILVSMATSNQLLRMDCHTIDLRSEYIFSSENSSKEIEC